MVYGLWFGWVRTAGLSSLGKITEFINYIVMEDTETAGPRELRHGPFSLSLGSIEGFFVLCPLTFSGAKQKLSDIRKAASMA